MSPFQILTFYFKIHFNITLISTSISFKLFLSFRFSYQTRAKRTANMSERTGRFTDRICDGDEVKITMSRDVTSYRLADIYRHLGWRDCLRSDSRLVRVNLSLFCYGDRRRMFLRKFGVIIPEWTASHRGRYQYLHCYCCKIFQYRKLGQHFWEGEQVTSYDSYRRRLKPTGMI
jgi:hypothetical protein